MVGDLDEINLQKYVVACPGRLGNDPMAVLPLLAMFQKDRRRGSKSHTLALGTYRLTQGKITICETEIPTQGGRVRVSTSPHVRCQVSRAQSAGNFVLDGTLVDRQWLMVAVGSG